MARISGVNIPADKPVAIALTYIYGIGRTTASGICRATGIEGSGRVKALGEEEIIRLREYIERHHRVEGELRREVMVNIKRLMDLGCYRGLRHRKSLPVRGQRTHSNARTRRGRSRPIAGKNDPRRK